jgi:transposase InsO family protein
MEEKLVQEIALFRYGLIADLLHLEPGTGQIQERLLEKAARKYEIPGSSRTRVAVGTMRDWLHHYRVDGFDGLKPRPRGDIGSARTLPPNVRDLLLSLKEEHPGWAVRDVIAQARQSPLVAQSLALPLSTVHRLLTSHGLMDKQPADPSSKDRRRFSFAWAGELWMSDVMHGPSVLTEGRRKQKTYLIAFLDDATRVVPHAAFTFAETIVAFLGVFKTALERRGIPERLYVDNGALYRCQRLALACAQLGITLIHTRPYDAPAKGKQERFFRTLRMQMLAHLGEQDLASLEALNRRLWAYIEGEYHHHPHRGLDGKTPLDRWAEIGHRVRRVVPSLDLDDLLLDEQKRRVHKDRTVCLLGRVFEVDAMLVGATVTLRFDPAHLDRPIQVFKDGKRFTDARIVDAYANCFVRRHRPSTNLEVSGSVQTSPSRLRLAELGRRARTREGR